MDRREIARIIAKAREDGATTLDLTGQGLGTLPPEIGNLTNLRSLVLSFNDLTVLPAEIGNLTNLVNLYLNNNQNRRGAPNENLARELMELFTLGEGNG